MAILTATAAVAHFTEPVVAPVLILLAAVGALLTFFHSIAGAQDAARGPVTRPSEMKPGGGDRDTTDRMMLQRPDARLAGDLAQAAAMAQLTARISHELRTPLNAVIGFSELMSRETFGPLGSQRYQDYANHIHECGQSLLKSAEDTLAITSALTQADASTAGGQQVLDLGGLVADAVEQISSSSQQQAIRWRIADLGEVEVVGDRRMLRQILVNLMTEAIARSRWHGEVCVDLRVEAGDLRLDISACSVRSAEHAETLALCVARALLELHGRRLDVRHDGRGFSASFQMQLALQPDFFCERADTVCHSGKPRRAAA